MPNTKQRVRVLPYKAGSASARALAERLGGKRIRLEGSRFRNTEKDFCINWGNSNPPENVDVRFLLNHPEAIKDASDKLKFFNSVRDAGLGDYIPQFWANAKDIPDEAFPVVCRTVLNGHSGRGIVISASRDDLVPAPLYTQYVKKQDEYRIHLGFPFKGDGQESIIIAAQQKKRRLDHPEDQVNWQVRNHDNGFIYAREGVNPPAAVINAARRVFDTALQLDFGAVDVVYNAKQDRAYVLEVNTAPGLEGQTLQDYANYFPHERV